MGMAPPPGLRRLLDGLREAPPLSKSAPGHEEPALWPYGPTALRGAAALLPDPRFGKATADVSNVHSNPSISRTSTRGPFSLKPCHTGDNVGAVLVGAGRLVRGTRGALSPALDLPASLTTPTRRAPHLLECPC